MFYKKSATTKKSVAYAFPVGELRASMPSSQKISVAQRSVQHFCVALAEVKFFFVQQRAPNRLAT